MSKHPSKQYRWSLGLQALVLLPLTPLWMLYVGVRAAFSDVTERVKNTWQVVVRGRW